MPRFFIVHPKRRSFLKTPNAPSHICKLFEDLSSCYSILPRGSTLERGIYRYAFTSAKSAFSHLAVKLLEDLANSARTKVPEKRLKTMCRCKF